MVYLYIEDTDSIEKVPDFCLPDDFWKDDERDYDNGEDIYEKAERFLKNNGLLMPESQASIDETVEIIAYNIYLKRRSIKIGILGEDIKELWNTPSPEEDETLEDFTSRFGRWFNVFLVDRLVYTESGEVYGFSNLGILLRSKL